MSDQTISIQSKIDALKDSIKMDLIYYKENPKMQETTIKFYENILADSIDSLNNTIDSYKKRALEEREIFDNNNSAKNIEKLMNQVVLIRDLKLNNKTEVLKEFLNNINNQLTHKNQKMAELQLTPEQDKLKNQYLKTIEYLGFNPAYHEPNIIKAIKEGNLSFSTNDLAKDNKNIKYELAFSINNMGNGKVSYKAENLNNGYKVVWPQLGAPIPKKEMTEGLLTGGFILTDLVKKDGEKYKVWMGIDKKNPPLTWEKGNRLFDKDNKCVNTHSGEFKVPVQYFAHEMTKKDVAILLNGKEIGVTTIDFKTGEKLMVNGLKVDFKPTPEGKTRFDFSYSEKKGTNEFISPNELQDIKDSIKQGKKEPTESLNEDEAKQEQQVKEKTKITEKVSDDSSSDDDDAPKKKKGQSKVGA